MTDTDWDPAGATAASASAQPAAHRSRQAEPAAHRPTQPQQDPRAPEQPWQPHEQQDRREAPPAPDPLPGRVWGIVSLAFAVIPLLQLVGLVAGIVGLVLSLRAGRRNWFAVAGIAVSLLLLIAAGVFVVLFAFSGYDVFGGSVGSVVEVCGELGRGDHVVDGLTYSCR